ncbi:hypothetical protein GQX74_010359 [Glossina fuscipes]|nr:hypothetical protein GQX74_010359 [Glossina fuscipes]
MRDTTSNDSDRKEEVVKTNNKLILHAVACHKVLVMLLVLNGGVMAHCGVTEINVKNCSVLAPASKVLKKHFALRKEEVIRRCVVAVVVQQYDVCFETQLNNKKVTLSILLRLHFGEKHTSLQLWISSHPDLGSYYMKARRALY